MIYSFDIFDTVVTRCVAKPRDVFGMMQERLLHTKDIDLPLKLMTDFSRIRCNSALKTRLISWREDIRLDDIYHVIGRSFRLSTKTVQDLAAFELQMEQYVLRPIIPVRNKINALKKNKQKVIFISDMYLSSSFLLRVLHDFDLRVAPDELFISGEIGSLKLTGRLFSHVLQALKLKPQELCHFGDNLLSDVLVPACLGINVPNKITVEN